MTCSHQDFNAVVSVTGLVDDPAKELTHAPADRWTADVRINCVQCGEPFRFLELPAGISFQRPMVSIDGLELRVPIEPQGTPRLVQAARFEMPPPKIGEA